MSGTLSFLLFAIFFFVMMKFGCGSHVAHGHHKQAKNEDTPPSPAIDPVCGMEVNENEGYGKLEEGILYRFCSKDCLDQFDSQPQQYKQSTKSEVKHLTQDHHHET